MSDVIYNVRSKMEKVFWVILCGEQVLLQKQGDVYTLPFLDKGLKELPHMNEVVCLPELDGEQCLGICFAEQIHVVETCEWIDLRTSFELLSAIHYGVVSKARQLQHWNQNSRYCGVCGGKMHFHTEISKVCEKCGREVWPFLQPAIIVLVTRNGGEEVLLVQSHNFRGDYYGLVAGYVETGETLEECVAREVLEETGCRVKNVRYVDSQSWPHPNTLMIGYYAEYDGGEFHLQDTELKKGGWFSKNNLPNIPRRVSLARRLIDRWISGNI